MKMPFGKFKGRNVEELSDDYLEWLLTIELRDRLAAAVKAEHERRMASQESREHINVKMVDELVGAGLRALAKKFHPDAGGSHEKMIAVTAAADWIRSQARVLT